MWTAEGGVKKLVYSSMVRLSQIPEGEIIFLNEGGKATEFYVAKQNYEIGLNGTGRTLLVRKECYNQRQWHTSDVNAWANCNLLSWLNSTYKSSLDTDIQMFMGTTKYYYTLGNGNNTVSIRSDSVFLLSMTELGFKGRLIGTEGSALSISNQLRIAYQNGAPTTQLSRSPSLNDSLYIWGVYKNGFENIRNCSYSAGVRPIFTLPDTFIVN